MTSSSRVSTKHLLEESFSLVNFSLRDVIAEKSLSRIADLILWLAGDLGSIRGLRGSFRTRRGGSCAGSLAGAEALFGCSVFEWQGRGAEYFWTAGAAEFKASELLCGGVSAIADAIGADIAPFTVDRVRVELPESLNVTALCCSLGFFDTCIRV